MTSVDVARRAGVSQSTVSLVLSGKGAGRISAKTEATVRAAAEELGYRPNAAARTLRTGTARTVGLVVTDVTHPFFGPVLRGAQAAAWRADYAVALVDVANDPDRELASFEALRAGPADGFMFFTVDPPEGSGEHVVAIEVEPPGMAYVRVDTERGTELAVRHLLDLGHTRIAHLGSWLDAETFRRRRTAIAAVLGDAVPYEQAPFDYDEACRATLRLLDADPRPTAVFCDDDILAGGVYLAARERGLRIPRGRLGRRLRRPAVRARVRAAADHDPPRPGGARRGGVRGAHGPDGGRPGGGPRAARRARGPRFDGAAARANVNCCWVRRRGIGRAGRPWRVSLPMAGKVATWRVGHAYRDQGATDPSRGRRTRSPTQPKLTFVPPRLAKSSHTYYAHSYDPPNPPPRRTPGDRDLRDRAGRSGLTGAAGRGRGRRGCRP